VFRTVALLLGFCLPIALSAAPVPADRAETAFRGWLRGEARPLGVALSRQVVRVWTRRDAGGNASYHVVSLAPEGFAVLAGDDLVEPVIAFSDRGSYDPEADSPLRALLRADLCNRVAQARRREKLRPPPGAGPAQVAHETAARAKWERLLEQGATSELPAGDANPVRALGIPALDDAGLRVPPLLKSEWSQSTADGRACYNYYTPPYAPGATSNYVSGCVATAMGQLMYFFRHPASGVGTGRHEISIDGTNQLRSLRGGDGIGGPYEWDDMVPVPADGLTEEQCRAIGALVHDAGVAAHMAYTASESLASMSDAADALEAVFGFGQALDSHDFPSGFSAAEFLPMIGPGLDAGLPVLLGIAGDAGGHAVVCDGYGYDGNALYHHVNMGWGGGDDDAWYALPIIDASTLFTAIDSVVYNIYTSGTGEIISGRVIDGEGNPVPGAIVTAEVSGGAQYTATCNDRGIYALTHLPPATEFSVWVSSGGPLFPNATSDVLTESTGTSTWSGSGNLWGVDFTLAASLPVRVVGEEGFGTGSFEKPRGVAVDSAGFVYVADSGNHRIQSMNPDTGTWIAWGSWGTAAGQFKQPLGLAVDGADNLYVADGNNNRIQVRNAGSGAWSVRGGYGTGVGQFSGPFDVAVDAHGNLFVADHYNNRVQKRRTNGQWGIFVSSGFDNGYVRRPNAVAVDDADNVLVLDYIPTVSNGLARLQKFAPNGTLIEVVVVSGEEDGILRLSLDVGFSATGQLLVADTGADRIRAGSSTSVWYTVVGPQTVSEPEGVVVDAARDRLYIADTGNDRVLMVFLSAADFAVNAAMDDNGFRVFWPGEYLRWYGVEYKHSLLDTSAWQALPDIPWPLVGSNGIMTCVDTNAALFPQRFYRISAY